MNDLDRLRTEYTRRDDRLAGSGKYSILNRAQLFMIQMRQRAVLSLLKKYGHDNLAAQDILEVGSGSGGVLAEFLWYGANVNRLFGCDLLLDRVESCRTTWPFLNVLCADGRYLPYFSNSFDLLLQFTVYSSILDTTVRNQMAREMQRVLKPGGMILWYDFWWNPSNRQTRGIRPAEIRQLFPDCEYQFERITLAPPITRRLAPVAWGLCLFLESLKVFNTHYLVAIRRLD